MKTEISEEQKAKNTAALIALEELRQATVQWLEDNVLNYKVVTLTLSRITLAPDDEEEEVIVLLRTAAGWEPFLHARDAGFTELYELDEVGAPAAEPQYVVELVS